MEKLVIPNIPEESKRLRAVDELPQSAAGKTIMTTEPKFIPEEAAEITIGEHTHFRIRMVDCVGYILPSALGYIENNMPRMVKTPWFEEEVPFGMAAEVGTQKVITEHATVGLVVTTDGSITNLPREEYAACEERVIQELQQLEKPFVVLVNAIEPHSRQTEALCESLRKKYHAAVLPVCCPELEEADIQEILTQLLYAFPIREVQIQTAGWITALDPEHWLRKSVFSSIRAAAEPLRYVRDVPMMTETLAGAEHILSASVQQIDLGTGRAVVSVAMNGSLFYQILGETTGLQIASESDLFPVLTELCKIKKSYDRIAPALEAVEATGYGIVMPQLEEMSLEEPEIIKQGGKYGVRLRASAPSIHMMKASIRTAVSPIVGTEKQSEELVMYLLEGFEEDPTKIWSSNIFGKSLHELVNEGLHSKLSKMPMEARLKLQETLERVINEGCSVLICFILYHFSSFAFIDFTNLSVILKLDLPILTEEACFFMDAKINELVTAMITLYHDDPKRIHHFMKVYAFASAIAQSEQVNALLQTRIEAAALVHDIGIHAAERKYRSAAGAYQEKEGPPLARAMLMTIGFSDSLIDRVCFLVGHHHTYTEIDGIDFQILVEADFLVNLY